MKGRMLIWVSLILRVSHVYQFVLAMIMNIELNPPHFDIFFNEQALAAVIYN